MLIKENKIWTPENSFLLEYKSKCETGEFLIGQELWQEFDNLVEDMSNDEYYYDTTEALERIDFIENCVKLTKDPYYGKPMKLMLWQKAFIETMYSFKMSKDGYDRFKKILLLIARKNGKSETSSGLALSEFIMGNKGSDIVCSSNDDSQASILYDAIDTMRKIIDPKNLDTKRNQRFIINKITDTKIAKISDRTRNKEGRNISWACCDEVHELQDNTIVKSIEQSQSLKKNPKLIIITTEGFVQDGYLDEELVYARQIINNEKDDPASKRYLPWLYTQDSEQEVWDGNRENRLWMKSNPTLGTIKEWDYLEEQIARAKDIKRDRIFILSKDFNIKQNGVQSWLNFQDYQYESEYNLEDFRGSYCLGAVDLAETTDLCCAKVLMMKDDDKKYIHSQYFICEGKLNDPKNDDHEAGARYREWAQKGLLTICPGNEVDLTEVAKWFWNLYQNYNIRLWKCGYDQRFAKEWLKAMDDYFGYSKQSGDLEMVLQNADTLNNALHLVESDLKHKLIIYGNNDMDKWCFKNAALKIDNQGKCLCVKQRNDMKIDGSVTLIILYEMFRRYKTEFKDLLK